MAAVPSIGRAAGVEPASVDADATHELYARYSDQIYGFCVNRLGSRDEAEDATQSTFLNAHRALKRGVTPEAELAWLFKIAHNVCLTRRRSWSRRNRVESPSDLGAVQDVLPAPSRETGDELIRLTDALAHMPDNQRRAILLREWQGLSYHEIADDLKLSQSAVETLIFRARRSLAANLEAEPERPRLLSRVRKAFDVATLLAAAKTLFVTSTAAKATAAAVAVTGAAVVAANSPQSDRQPFAFAKTETPVAVAEARSATPVIAGVDLERRTAPLVRRAPVAAPAKASPAAAAAKERAAERKAAKQVPPGQAKKAVAVSPGRANPPKPVRALEPAAKPRPVRAAPARRALPPKAKAPKPTRPAKVAPAKGAKSNGGGIGNGKGGGKPDG